MCKIRLQVLLCLSELLILEPMHFIDRLTLNAFIAKSNMERHPDKFRQKHKEHTNDYVTPEGKGMLVTSSAVQVLANLAGVQQNQPGIADAVLAVLPPDVDLPFSDPPPLQGTSKSSTGFALVSFAVYRGSPCKRSCDLHLGLSLWCVQGHWA
jgi:hypothetical protein